MSYGYRVYRRDTISPGAAQAATYTQIASGSGYQHAYQARNAAVVAREAATPSSDAGGPDASGVIFQVFGE